MPLCEAAAQLESRYRKLYSIHGYSPKSLGWEKGKQMIRFDILTSQYDFTGKSVIDIGCGFGDLNKTLKRWQNSSYFGVDLVEEFIALARQLYGCDGVAFDCGDFLKMDYGQVFDYAICSGAFNVRLRDNYDFVDASMAKACEIARDGFAFYFLSDKVDYELGHAFHFSPSRILDMAYKYSRNVVLRNDYMPFEFSIFVFKDDSFTTHDTMFNRYKELSGITDANIEGV